MIVLVLSSNDGSLTEALLKTKVLLHQIGKKELTDWVNKELNGYPEDAELPPYRIIPSRVLANAANIAWQATAHPIPLAHLKPEQREKLERSRVTESLSVVEQLADKNAGTVRRPIPMEANGILSRGLASDMQVQQAWCEISPIHFHTRLLDFLLEFKDLTANATSENEIKERATSENVTPMFNKNSVHSANGAGT
jgi:hypothetical protein